MEFPYENHLNDDVPFVVKQSDVKVIILAGGMGTRLKEETEFKPKPLVEIGGMPLILHIMKIYSHYGFNDFIVALGYKGDMIKNYFLNYLALNNDIKIDLKKNEVKFITKNKESFKVTLVNTGLNAMTGGRIKKLQKYVGDNTFMVTYGDGVADININNLYEFHKKNKKLATITGVHPSSRFGELDIKENLVVNFQEKPQVKDSYINGGFFVFEPEFFNYLPDDETIMLERQPFDDVSKDKNLVVYKHTGFWKCVDTFKDYEELNKIWKEKAPWKVWE